MFGCSRFLLSIAGQSSQNGGLQNSESALWVASSDPNSGGYDLTHEPDPLACMSQQPTFRQRYDARPPCHLRARMDPVLHLEPKHTHELRRVVRHQHQAFAACVNCNVQVIHTDGLLFISRPMNGQSKFLPQAALGPQD